MNWNPKFYLVYPDEIIDQIPWPEECDYQCVAHFPSMLRQVLKIDAIGSEIKLVWNDWHRNEMLKRNNITSDQLENYLKSGCSILSFEDRDVMDKVATTLRNMGITNFVCVESYREVILQQAFYKENKRFNLV